MTDPTDEQKLRLLQWIEDPAAYWEERAATAETERDRWRDLALGHEVHISEDHARIKELNQRITDLKFETDLGSIRRAKALDLINEWRGSAVASDVPAPVIADVRTRLRDIYAALDGDS